MTKGEKCEYCSYFISLIREFLDRKALCIINERELEENKCPQFTKHGTIIINQPQSITKRKEIKPEVKSRIPRLTSLKKHEKYNKVVI